MRGCRFVVSLVVYILTLILLLQLTIAPTPGGSCGDGSCNNGETCSDCPTDCGVCPPDCTNDLECCPGGTCQANTYLCSGDNRIYCALVDGCYKIQTTTNCLSSGKVCDQGTCCTPTTCASVECGTIDQKCGLGDIVCPDTCTYGYDCSGNSCVCNVAEQEVLFCTGKECGSTTVCGGTPIICGDGPGDEGCPTGNTCTDGACNNNVPSVSISPTSASTTTGNSVTFYATISDDNGITQVTATNNGASTQNLDNCEGIPGGCISRAFTYTFNNVGTSTIVLSATDTAGVTRTKSATVQVTLSCSPDCTTDGQKQCQDSNTLQTCVNNNGCLKWSYTDCTSPLPWCSATALTCVQCTSSSHCLAPKTCTNGVCTCPQSCTLGYASCSGEDLITCITNGECTQYYQASCASRDSTKPYCLDVTGTTNDRCVQCETNAQCGSGEYCDTSNGQYVCKDEPCSSAPCSDLGYEYGDRWCDGNTLKQCGEDVDGCERVYTSTICSNYNLLCSEEVAPPACVECKTAGDCANPQWMECVSGSCEYIDCPGTSCPVGEDHGDEWCEGNVVKNCTSPYSGCEYVSTVQTCSGSDPICFRESSTWARCTDCNLNTDCLLNDNYYGCGFICTAAKDCRNDLLKSACYPHNWSKCNIDVNSCTSSGYPGTSSYSCLACTSHEELCIDTGGGFYGCETRCQTTNPSGLYYCNSNTHECVQGVCTNKCICGDDAWYNTACNTPVCGVQADYDATELDCNGGDGTRYKCFENNPGSGNLATGDLGACSSPTPLYCYICPIEYVWSGNTCQQGCNQDCDNDGWVNPACSVSPCSGDADSTDPNCATSGGRYHCFSSAPGTTGTGPLLTPSCFTSTRENCYSCDTGRHWWYDSSVSLWKCILDCTGCTDDGWVNSQCIGDCVDPDTTDQACPTTDGNQYKCFTTAPSSGTKVINYRCSGTSPTYCYMCPTNSIWNGNTCVSTCPTCTPNDGWCQPGCGVNGCPTDTDCTGKSLCLTTGDQRCLANPSDNEPPSIIDLKSTRYCSTSTFSSCWDCPSNSQWFGTGTGSYCGCGNLLWDGISCVSPCGENCATDGWCNANCGTGNCAATTDSDCSLSQCTLPDYKCLTGNTDIQAPIPLSVSTQRYCTTMGTTCWDCPANALWSGNVCECPSGMGWSAGQCVTLCGEVCADDGWCNTDCGVGNCAGTPDSDCHPLVTQCTSLNSAQCLTATPQDINPPLPIDIRSTTQCTGTEFISCWQCQGGAMWFNNAGNWQCVCDEPEYTWSGTACVPVCQEDCDEDGWFNQDCSTSPGCITDLDGGETACSTLNGERCLFSAPNDAESPIPVSLVNERSCSTATFTTCWDCEDGGVWKQTGSLWTCSCPNGQEWNSNTQMCYTPCPETCIDDGWCNQDCSNTPNCVTDVDCSPGIPSCPTTGRCLEQNPYDNNPPTALDVSANTKCTTNDFTSCWTCQDGAVWYDGANPPFCRCPEPQVWNGQQCIYECDETCIEDGWCNDACSTTQGCVADSVDCGKTICGGASSLCLANDPGDLTPPRALDSSANNQCNADEFSSCWTCEDGGLWVNDPVAGWRCRCQEGYIWQDNACVPNCLEDCAIDGWCNPNCGKNLCINMPDADCNKNACSNDDIFSCMYEETGTLLPQAQKEIDFSCFTSLEQFCWFCPGGGLWSGTRCLCSEDTTWIGSLDCCAYEYIRDVDGDKYYLANSNMFSCSYPGGGYLLYDKDVYTAVDCDDTRASCNIDCTSQLYRDADSDGFGNEQVTIRACDAPSGYVDEDPLGFDCNDNNANMNPNADDVCNGINDDCDDLTDEDAMCGTGYFCGGTQGCVQTPYDIVVDDVIVNYGDTFLIDYTIMQNGNALAGIPAGMLLVFNGLNINSTFTDITLFPTIADNVGVRQAKIYLMSYDRTQVFTSATMNIYVSCERVNNLDGCCSERDDFYAWEYRVGGTCEANDYCQPLCGTQYFCVDNKVVRTPVVEPMCSLGAHICTERTCNGVDAICTEDNSTGSMMFIDTALLDDLNKNFGDRCCTNEECRGDFVCNEQTKTCGYDGTSANRCAYLNYDKEELVYSMYAINSKIFLCEYSITNNEYDDKEQGSCPEGQVSLYGKPLLYDNAKTFSYYTEQLCVEACPTDSQFLCYGGAFTKDADLSVSKDYGCSVAGQQCYECDDPRDKVFRPYLKEPYCAVDCNIEDADKDSDGYYTDVDDYFKTCETYKGYEDDNCDDSATNNPGLQERCGDFQDNDCDNDIDEGCACTLDMEGERCKIPTLKGVCANGQVQCSQEGQVECVQINYATDEEICGNEIDDTCDGRVDVKPVTKYLDYDSRGKCVIVEDNECDMKQRDGFIPEVTEIDDCRDFIDNDCDGDIDCGDSDCRYTIFCDVTQCETPPECISDIDCMSEELGEGECLFAGETVCDGFCHYSSIPILTNQDIDIITSQFNLSFRLRSKNNILYLDLFGMPVRNLIINISIDKSVVDSASLLEGDFNVLEDDPLIQIRILQMITNKTIQIKFPKDITAEDMEKIKVTMGYQLWLTGDESVDFRSLVKSENGRTIINLDLFPQGKSNVKTAINIPKCLAQSLKEFGSLSEGYEIINDDPLIVWDFDKIEDDRNIRIEIPKEVDEECLKQIRAAVLSERTSFFTFKHLIPVLVIPLVALIIIVFSQFGPKRERKIIRKKEFYATAKNLGYTDEQIEEMYKKHQDEG